MLGEEEDFSFPGGHRALIHDSPKGGVGADKTLWRRIHTGLSNSLDYYKIGK